MAKLVRCHIDTSLGALAAARLGAGPAAVVIAPALIVLLATR
jgi:hypothetical protein